MIHLFHVSSWENYFTKKTYIKNISLNFLPGDKIGVLIFNRMGKSRLLRSI